MHTGGRVAFGQPLWTAARRSLLRPTVEVCACRAPLRLGYPLLIGSMGKGFQTRLTSGASPRGVGTAGCERDGNGTDRERRTGLPAARAPASRTGRVAQRTQGGTGGKRSREQASRRPEHRS
ncbi:hypothetical protein GCM10010277_65670 [Streptomyces longisporoflavus]|nr:hypothetical protein GCM10010277_65670 [Streptomyces longisporoflavus]